MKTDIIEDARKELQKHRLERELLLREHKASLQENTVRASKIGALQKVINWRKRVGGLLDEEGENRRALVARYLEKVLAQLEGVKRQNGTLADTNFKLKGIDSLKEEAAYLNKLNRQLQNVNIRTKDDAHILERQLRRIEKKFIHTYGDETFAKKILESGETKRLTNFEWCVERVTLINNIIQDAWKTGDWRRFWSEMKNIDSISNELAKKGFADVAKSFMATRKRAGNPGKPALEPWKEAIDRVYLHISDERYFQQTVVAFKHKMAVMIAERQKDILAAVIKVVKRRRDIIGKNGKKMINEVKKEMKPFESYYNEFLVAIGRIAEIEDERKLLEGKYSNYAAEIDKLYSTLGRNTFMRLRWAAQLMNIVTRSRDPSSILTSARIGQLAEQINYVRIENSRLTDREKPILKEVNKVIARINNIVEDNNRIVDRIDKMIIPMIARYRRVKPKVDMLLERLRVEGMRLAA